METVARILDPDDNELQFVIDYDSSLENPYDVWYINSTGRLLERAPIYEGDSYADALHAIAERFE